MGERLDDLLGELACADPSAAPEELELSVWRQVDTRAAAGARLRSGVVAQGLIGALALLMGFSYQAFQQGHAFAAPLREPRPSLKLLDGSAVAEAGAFQVLR